MMKLRGVIPKGWLIIGHGINQNLVAQVLGGSEKIRHESEVRMKTS